MKPQSTCPSGKQQYASRAEANGHLGRIRRKRENPDREQTKYLCVLCLQWHLTSHPRKRKPPKWTYRLRY